MRQKSPLPTVRIERSEVRCHALLHSAQLRPSVDAASDYPIAICFCDSQTDLLVRLGQSPGDNVVVISFGASDDDRAALAAVRAVSERHPEVPIIGYGLLTRQLACSLIKAAQGGLTEIALQEHDDLRLVIRRALAGKGERIDTVLHRALSHLVPDDLRAVVFACVSGGRCVPVSSVDEVARSLRMTRRTLSKKLCGFALPAAGELIGWGRLLLVSLHLDERTSIEAVALRLEFSSASALHNLSKRYLQLTPRELLSAGGPLYVVSRLAERLGRSRSNSQ